MLQSLLKEFKTIVSTVKQNQTGISLIQFVGFSRCKNVGWLFFFGSRIIQLPPVLRSCHLIAGYQSHIGEMCDCCTSASAAQPACFKALKDLLNHWLVLKQTGGEMSSQRANGSGWAGNVGQELAEPTFPLLGSGKPAASATGNSQLELQTAG